MIHTKYGIPTHIIDCILHYHSPKIIKRIQKFLKIFNTSLPTSPSFSPYVMNTVFQD